MSLPPQEAHDSLSELYQQLAETDYAACVWHARPGVNSLTAVALVYEQLGQADKAHATVERLLTSTRNVLQQGALALTAETIPELHLWESTWIQYVVLDTVLVLARALYSTRTMFHVSCSRLPSLNALSTSASTFPLMTCPLTNRSTPITTSQLQYS